MPILGIGVDLVHVPRFVGMLTRRSPRRVAHFILRSDAERAEFAARFPQLEQLEQRDRGPSSPSSTSATGTVHAATTPPWEASEAQATLTPVARYLAGRWAAKEAAFKALSGHHTLAWDQCRVLTRRPPADAAGPVPIAWSARGDAPSSAPAASSAPRTPKPFLDLALPVQSPFVTGAHLAITHDGDYVLAQVTIEGHD